LSWSFCSCWGIGIQFQPSICGYSVFSALFLKRLSFFQYDFWWLCQNQMTVFARAYFVVINSLLLVYMCLFAKIACWGCCCCSLVFHYGSVVQFICLFQLFFLLLCWMGVHCSFYKGSYNVLNILYLN
jgi:hypothetical protein